METRTSGNRLSRKIDRKKVTAPRLSATEIRRLPKAQREKILDEQFRMAKKYYAEHPGLLIDAGQPVINY